MTKLDQPGLSIQSKTTFQNAKTNRPYSLVRANEIVASDKIFEAIRSICNEPEIYDFLFRSSLAGEPYPLKKAQDFLNWAAKGWSDSTHFVFLIINDQGDICGAADIKSNSFSRAEIGYWASKAHTGIMTPAITALTGIAKMMGFKCLIAFGRFHLN